MMIPRKQQQPLASQLSPALDTFSNNNAAVGANAATSSTASNGSGFGGALTQLYGTQPQMQVVGSAQGTGLPNSSMSPDYSGVANTSAPTRPVYDPTLQGGQFPPQAPVVSGLPNSLGPSLQNSMGDAASDTVQRTNYIASLPLFAARPTTGSGAAVNGYMAEGPAQPGGMPGLGAILQGMVKRNGQQDVYGKLNKQPPTAGLNMMFPSGVGGGGLF